MLSGAPDSFVGAPPLLSRPAILVSYLSTRAEGAGHNPPELLSHHGIRVPENHAAPVRQAARRAAPHVPNSRCTR